MTPLRVTVEIQGQGWQPMYLLDERAEIHPAPSDMAVHYGSMIVFGDGRYVYARETPDQLSSGGAG